MARGLCHSLCGNLRARPISARFPRMSSPSSSAIALNGAATPFSAASILGGLLLLLRLARR